MGWSNLISDSDKALEDSFDKDEVTPDLHLYQGIHLSLMLGKIGSDNQEGSMMLL